MLVDDLPGVCRILTLGLVPYPQALELQRRLAADIAAGRQPPTLLLLEHPHVYTFGRSGREEHLLWDEERRRKMQVEVHWTDRGGDVTYHGPGQLIGYPLVPLGRIDPGAPPPRPDVIAYLRRLETVLIRALAQLGLVTGQVPGKSGVWVQPDVASRCRRCPPSARRQPAKIASIGVKLDASGITRHGFALNVAPDMTYFEGIIACGLADHPAVSLEQLVEPAPTMPLVRSHVVSAFAEVFDWTPAAGELPDQARAA